MFMTLIGLMLNFTAVVYFVARYVKNHETEPGSTLGGSFVCLLLGCAPLSIVRLALSSRCVHATGPYEAW